MVVVADSSIDRIFQSFFPVDADLLDVFIIEIELADPDSGTYSPDPQHGLEMALSYAKAGKRIIAIGEKEYCELRSWNDLLINKNIVFCLKPIREDCFLSAIVKLDKQKKPKS